MEEVAIILQARMGSQRLPGKVLADIGSRTILEHCVRRLSASALPIVVATTDLFEDDAIVGEAARLGVAVYRGEAEDVLARYIGAAQRYGFTRVVRATADNPFVDGDSPQRVLDHARRLKADHVVEAGLPIGAAVEAVSLDALERARDWVTDQYDREHVTSFIRRDARFHSVRAVAPADMRRPGLRLTVDTSEDLNFARAVYAALGAAGRAARLPYIIQTAEAVLGRHLVGARARRGA